MRNNQRRHLPPLLPRHRLHQIQFNPLRILVPRKPHPLRDADHMGIHRNPLILPKARPQDDRRSFPTDALQLNELPHRLRNFTAMMTDEPRAHLLQKLCFVPVCATRMNILFQFFPTDSDVIFGCLIFFMQRLHHNIHARIRTLGAQNRCDEEIQWSPPCQERTRGFVEFFESPEDGLGGEHGITLTPGAGLHEYGFRL